MPQPFSRNSPMAAYFAAAIAVLIAYACLHPFTGWRDPGLPLTDFLFAPWPHYYSLTDLLVNVLGFIPLTFPLVPALPARLRSGRRVLLAVLIALMLSFTLETLQNFLPSRVSSNLDLGCNTLGGLIGALAGARWGNRLFDRRGGLSRWRHRWVVGGHLGEVGLVLLGLWLLTLLTPESLLFATGDLRRLFDLPTPIPFNPQRFVKVEAAITASQFVAVGLTARSMMRESSLLSILLLITLGLAAKTLAAALFFSPGDPLHWATPGGQIGLAAGAALLTAALILPERTHGMIAGLALLVGTALVNLAPENPFLSSETLLILRGNLLNFHGLTQLVASLWPFAAFLYLGILGLVGARERPQAAPIRR